MKVVTPIHGRNITKSFPGWILGLVVLFGVVGLAAPPATAEPPKTGSTGKTEKQCNADYKACQNNCDKTIIDIDNHVQQCKDLCTDTMVICQPAAKIPRGETGGFSGGQLQVAPTNPAPKTSPIQKPNAPIRRRGIGGVQSGEPAPKQPEQTNQSSETK
ncbi:MAG: hypothetical protein ABI618_01885 [Nitrospirota bacterium]